MNPIHNLYKVVEGFKTNKIYTLLHYSNRCLFNNVNCVSYVWDENINLP